MVTCLGDCRKKVGWAGLLRYTGTPVSQQRDSREYIANPASAAALTRRNPSLAKSVRLGLLIFAYGKVGCWPGRRPMLPISGREGSWSTGGGLPGMAAIWPMPVQPVLLEEKSGIAV